MIYVVRVCPPRRHTDRNIEPPLSYDYGHASVSYTHLTLPTNREV